jgi:hypothetical protein
MMIASITVYKRQDTCITEMGQDLGNLGVSEFIESTHT